MGWTYTYKPPGTKVRPFLRERFSQPFIAGEKDGFRILHDTATLRAYFAIVERSPQDGRTPVLFCLVCLTDHVREHYNFGYKDMTEACGPNIIAPKSFFDVLERLIPEPDGAYGADWRARSRAAYAHRSTQLALGPGQIVEFQDKRYRLLEKVPRRGFRVADLHTGGRHLMSRAQLLAARIVTDAADAGALL